MNKYNFTVYEPMLVGKAPKNLEQVLSYKNKKIMGSVKKDGYWEQLIKENNQVYLFSRSVSKQTNFYSEKIDHVPHIKKWAMDFLPNGTCLIGEMYYPTKTSKEVTSILGALTNKAIQRQKDNGNLHFYIHDVLKWNGQDFVLNQIPYAQRYDLLCNKILNQNHTIKEIELAQNYDNYSCNLINQIQKNLSLGEEGMVFRYADSVYMPGKRKPNIMFKVKRATDNIDFVITKILDPEYYYTGKESDTWQYKDSDGKLITKAAYYNWAGAIQVGAYDDVGKLIAVGRVASGLTDEMKEDMAKNPDKYIGQVCEVQAMSLDKDALTFRHPFFVRMRPDKPAEDCKISEIFS